MEKGGTSGGASQFSFSWNLSELSWLKRRAMVNPSVFYHASEIPIEDSPRNGMKPEVAVEYRHVDGTGWFNDPTRYNILGGPRNTAPRSEKKPANPDTTKPPHPRLTRLRTVASNINDKAEAFIDWMKEKISDKF